MRFWRSRLRNLASGLPDFTSAPEDFRERVEIPEGADRVDTRLLRGGSNPGFYVKEIAAPAGYLPVIETMEAFPGVGEDDARAVLMVENPVIRGRIVLEKRGEALESAAGGEGDSIPLPDVTFRIYSSSTGAIADPIVTGPDGIARSGLLPYGRYRVEEMPCGGNLDYIPASPFELELREPAEEVYRVVGNVAVRIPVELVKIDTVTGEPVTGGGFSFAILNAAGQVLRFPVDGDNNSTGEVLYADADGCVTVPGGLTAGSYFARELCAPPGYVCCEEPIPFTVETGEDRFRLEVPNEPTALEIRKTDPAGAPLADALFRLEKAGGGICRFTKFDGVYRPSLDGDPVLRSDKDGLVRIHALPVGGYTLTETKAPAGYLLPSVCAVPVTIGIRSRVTAPAAIALKNVPEPTPTPIPEPTPEPTSVPKPTPVPTRVPGPTPVPQPSPVPTIRITLPPESVPEAKPIPETGEIPTLIRRWLRPFCG
jgi:hypothetical protein